MTLDKQTLLKAAARGYYTPENSHKELDADLLHAIVAEILVTQQPESIWGASKQEEPNEPINTLLRFYGVLTLSALVLAQSHHIERLQSKLPLLKDERPGYVPREG